MKLSPIRLQTPAEEARILGRQTRQQADEPISNLQQPTDVEVDIDGSDDIEAFERAEAEKQQQASYQQIA